MPAYKKLNHYIKNKNLCASLFVFLIIAIIFLSMWFAIPIVIKQAFDLLLVLQQLDLSAVVKALFPSASSTLVSQITLTLSNAVSAAFSGGSTTLNNYLR